jgi:hypothetical protein
MRLVPLATLTPTISVKIGIVIADPPPASVLMKPAARPPPTSKRTWRVVTAAE